MNTTNRIAAVVFTILFGLLLIYRFFPGVTLAAIYQSYALRSGVSAEVAEIPATDSAPALRVPYYQGGQNQQIMVLLHGFGDSKISFVQSARWLVPHYTVIMPDVPGFGDTDYSANESYGPRSQVARLHRFLEHIQALRNGPIILGGNSMGGHISAAYALQYPENVQKLLLLDSAGLRVDDPVPYKPSAAPLRTNEDFDAYLDGNFVKKPWVPGPFRKMFIEKSQANFERLNQIRADIRADQDYILNDRIQQIAQPTLVLWGDQDTTVSPAHARYWDAQLPDSTLIILEAMGHSPQYERPQETAQLLLDFLQAP